MYWFPPAERGMYGCPASRAFFLSSIEASILPSISRIAVSVAVFRTRFTAVSMFSWVMTSQACCMASWPGRSWGSPHALMKLARKWLMNVDLNGSLHVTIARLDARLWAIMCEQWRSLASSPSVAKSFATSSRVVVHAIITDRSTQGWMMSAVARSMAEATKALRSGLPLRIGLLSIWGLSLTMPRRNGWAMWDSSLAGNSGGEWCGEPPGPGPSTPWLDLWPPGPASPPSNAE
mmetsp:Transcript_67559/g.119836  ORF Transcript_67559/g.119836 Transcript_67559/m.119836 type:complete len:234 (-) Transcript_67559:3979-4680(-)